MSGSGSADLGGRSAGRGRGALGGLPGRRLRALAGAGGGTLRATAHGTLHGLVGGVGARLDGLPGNRTTGLGRRLRRGSAARLAGLADARLGRLARSRGRARGAAGHRALGRLPRTPGSGRLGGAGSLAARIGTAGGRARIRAAVRAGISPAFVTVRPGVRLRFRLLLCGRLALGAVVLVFGVVDHGCSIFIPPCATSSSSPATAWSPAESVGPVQRTG